jgi:hypothetical protein
MQPPFMRRLKPNWPSAKNQPEPSLMDIARQVEAMANQAVSKEIQAQQQPITASIEAAVERAMQKAMRGMGNTAQATLPDVVSIEEPVFIPSSIVGEVQGDPVTVQAETSNSGSMDETAQALKQLRKRGRPKKEPVE